MQYSAAAIITAGGVGRRMESEKPKQFIKLHDKPILIHTLEKFVSISLFTEIVLVSPKKHSSETKLLLQKYNLIDSCILVNGGATRQDSVEAGLRSLSDSITHVLVHDGVRPIITKKIIEDCLQSAYLTGAAIAAVPVKDTLKKASGHVIAETVSRDSLWRAQTPQAAKVSLLKEAYAKAKSKEFTGTDEASLLELLGVPVTLVQGSEKNIKITLPEDISMAENLLNREHGAPAKPVFKVGHGYDAHRLVKERDLVLGGMTIPHSKGLLGHSDADVLCHALCDALLGAIGQGDIGHHFPDSDPAYKGANSLELLKTVINIVKEEKYLLCNADITVIAQKPKLAPFVGQMRENIANACDVRLGEINIKASTTEKMGFAGREEGMACHAVVLVSKVFE